MTPLLTTSDVARLLGVSPDFVRAHARELGGIRIGHPDRGELRFAPGSLNDYLERRRLHKPEPAASRRRPGPRRNTSHVPLIPMPKGAS